MSKRFIGILNGPNLGRLGQREPEIYGHETLADLEERLRIRAGELGIGIECRQSNHEGELIDTIESWADGGAVGLILNPGAFTHTSVALRDAIAGCGIDTIEVHLSNIYRRESFRHQSLTAATCRAVISGLGVYGYLAALEFFSASLEAGGDPAHPA
jgi:3-dehydroquinate dehydratase-2